MWGNEHLTFISEALSSDQLTEQLMDQVLAIVKDHTTASSDEEVELDLDLLPKEALWKLYDLIVATMGGGVATPTTATPGGMAPAVRGVVVRGPLLYLHATTGCERQRWRLIGRRLRLMQRVCAAGCVVLCVGYAPVCCVAV